MKKISVFSLAIILLPILNFAQEQDNLPFYTPPSPNAYELGKYGQIPVGMFTGTPTFNLPLYEYKTKNLTVPVSVSYSSNGIKVDQVESKVGLGWSLNAGGVITRIVRDLPDEEQDTFFPETDIGENGVHGPGAAEFFYQAGQDRVDTETDLFMYNFSGKSGKFVYDNNKKIIQMPYSDLKIEPYPIDYEKNGYIITDADGIRYFFLNTEISRSYTVPNNHPDPSFVLTSWYLTKIIHPDGDVINFQYDSESYNYVSSISQTLEVLYPKIQPDGCGDRISMTPIDRSYNNHSVINGWRLTGISSTNTENGKVKFISDPSYAQVGIPGNKLINRIVVIDKDSNEIEKIGLSYDYYSNSNRIFLDSIKFKDPDKYYKFDYLEPSSMVSRLSFQQDHWGYYNGAILNTCLVPKIKNDDAFSDFNIGANRAPAWNYSKRGLLSKISYPTKGSTELTYEPNTYYGELINYPDQVESYLVSSTDDQGGGDNPVYDTIYSATNQRASVTVYVDYNFPPCDPLLDEGRSRVTLEIRDMVTNQEVEYYTISQTGIPVPRIGNVFTDNPPVSYCFADLDANTFYKVILTPKWACVRTSSTIRYYDQPPDTVITNVETGGSRINKIVSFDPVQNKSNITRYYYGSMDSLDISSGDPGQKAYYITHQKRKEECFQPVLTPYIKTVKILSSSSLTPLFNTGNNNIFYKSITVSHGGDNFENGGEEFDYIIHRDLIGNCLAGEEIKSAPWTNTGWDNGLERRSITFKKNDSGDKTILKETKNYYCTDSRNYDETFGYSVRKECDVLFPSPFWYTCTGEDVTKSYLSYNCTTSHRHTYLLIGSQALCIAIGANNVPSTVYDLCYGLPPNTPISCADISNLDIMEYKNISYWQYLDSTTTVLFDQSGLNPLKNTIHYKYNNPEHIQLTSTEFKSSTGDSIRQVTYYPHDMNQSAITDSLINKHRISERIKEEKYVMTDNQSWQKISTKYSNYFNWGNGIIQPSTIEESIYSETLEPRARIYNVDNTTGNPQEFSKEDDLHTAYVWGYQKTKPVVEGKNISFNDLNNAVNLTTSDLEQLLSPSGVGDLTSPTQRNSWKNFNESLRSQPTLVYAMITTYTYKPLIGLTSSTDPGGKTTYYQYDSFGRLIFVRDNDYNIVKKYDYHYATEQATK